VSTIQVLFPGAHLPYMMDELPQYFHVINVRGTMQYLKHNITFGLPSSVDQVSFLRRCHSTAQEISCLSLHSNFNYCAHKRPPLDACLSLINPLYNTTHYFKIRPSMLKSTKWSLNFRFSD